MAAFVGVNVLLLSLAMGMGWKEMGREGGGPWPARKEGGDPEPGSGPDSVVGWAR